MYQVEKKALGETEACLCAHRDAPGRESQSGGPGRAVPCGAGGALGFPGRGRGDGPGGRRLGNGGEAAWLELSRCKDENARIQAPSHCGGGRCGTCGEFCHGGDSDLQHERLRDERP